jgi:hypothetical protein
MVNDYGPSGQNRDDVAPRRPRSLDSVDLELVSMTTGFLETMLDQQGQPDVQFDGVKLWEGWTASDRPGMAFRLAQLRAMPELLPWLMYAIVRRSDGQMVGHVGFHGTPGLHSGRSGRSGTRRSGDRLLGIPTVPSQGLCIGRSKSFNPMGEHQSRNHVLRGLNKPRKHRLSRRCNQGRLQVLPEFRLDRLRTRGRLHNASQSG